MCVCVDVDRYWLIDPDKLLSYSYIPLILNQSYNIPIQIREWDTIWLFNIAMENHHL